MELEGVRSLPLLLCAAQSLLPPHLLRLFGLLLRGSLSLSTTLSLTSGFSLIKPPLPLAGTFEIRLVQAPGNFKPCHCRALINYLCVLRSMPKEYVTLVAEELPITSLTQMRSMTRCSNGVRNASLSRVQARGDTA